MTDIGSPPRVWGQLPIFPANRLSARFTPTRVGTTPRPSAATRTPPVHPHACGDNTATPHDHHGDLGSPPRVWGQQQRQALDLRKHRFTPTRVGTTEAQNAAWASIAVHPHACGDNKARDIRAQGAVGSPPRVWGQLVGDPVGRGEVRFTPTRVGTTLSVKLAPVALTVHPHACGDNLVSSRTLRSSIGSPPRVWGQRRLR